MNAKVSWEVLQIPRLRFWSKKRSKIFSLVSLNFLVEKTNSASLKTISSRSRIKSLGSKTTLDFRSSVFPFSRRLSKMRQAAAFNEVRSNVSGPPTKFFPELLTISNGFSFRLWHDFIEAILDGRIIWPFKKLNWKWKQTQFDICNSLNLSWIEKNVSKTNLHRMIIAIKTLV